MNEPRKIVFWRYLLLLLSALAAPCGYIYADATQPDLCAAQHPMDDAWWTGPMLANTAATAPRGHLLFETYVYDVTTQGRYLPDGTRQSAKHANSYGSLTYFMYGLTDRTSIGMIPTAGYNQVSGSPSSAGIRPGDLTLHFQRRLAQFHPCRRIPIVSVALQETLPTGKFDKLRNRPSDGLGAGAYTTNLAVYSQMYFWLPNRRILRTRFNVSEAFSSNVKVQGSSVYGTEAGFRGTAQPGSSLVVDSSWEYSLTRRWVLALDAIYRDTRNTRVAGVNLLNPDSSQSRAVQMNSGASIAYGFAPAVEYSWTSNVGILLGARIIAAGRNTSETITPAIAINIFH